jgi:hypothetical protein
MSLAGFAFAKTTVTWMCFYCLVDRVTLNMIDPFCYHSVQVTKASGATVTSSDSSPIKIYHKAEYTLAKMSVSLPLPVFTLAPWPV